MGAYRMGPANPRVPVLPVMPAELVPADPEQAAWAEQRASLMHPLLVLAWDHRAQLMPFTWMATADAVAAGIHYGMAGGGFGGFTARVFSTAGAAIVAAGWAAWRTREGRLGQKVKLRATIRKIRADVKRAWAGGTAWALLAVAWTPVGPHGAMQIVLLGGGVAAAARHWHRIRQRVEPEEPVKEIDPPREDVRLTRFRDHFCGKGPLEFADLHDFKLITGGFQFQVTLSLAASGTFRDVQMLQDQIAKLYDVPPDHVSVEPPESRSARRAVVAVLTAAKAHQREDAWDGESTYDPANGTFVLGRLANGDPDHWQIHKPYNGACCGIAVGVRGSGKTGTLHVVGAESGQAKLCIECGAARSCATCRLARICGVWMGDPQRQGFAVWKGKADLTAWGPLSCVRALHWGFAAMRARSAVMGEMEWTDHLGRKNAGKGWFDPTPQFPQLTIIIDEWPMIARDPKIGPWATYFAERIGDESRKVGVVLILGSQEGDVDILGSRGLRNALIADNAVGHRSDRLTRQMLELEGNPAELPEGAPGVGYLRGFDGRSGIVHRTKTLREYLRPGETGVDVREIADRIAADPIRFDQAILDALVPLGYTGPGQVLDDDRDGWTVDMLENGEAWKTETADEADTPAPEDTRRRPTTPVSPHDLSAVWKACESGAVEIYDVLVQTGLDALTANRAVDRLIDDGYLRQNADGTYAPATLTP